MNNEHVAEYDHFLISYPTMTAVVAQTSTARISSSNPPCESFRTISSFPLSAKLADIIALILADIKTVVLLNKNNQKAEEAAVSVLEASAVAQYLTPLFRPDVKNIE
jgi:hypothetical protein